MKKTTTFHRMIALFLSIALVSILIPSIVSATPGTYMSIRVRIEGIAQIFYDGTISVPYATPTLSVQTALAYLDIQTADVTITGVASGFISDVNGDASGTFGGWDGWLFRVNNVEPSSGIDTALLNSGDTILLYYGGPYDFGMQYPDVDSSRIGSGILKFTSQDTTYAPGPITTTNPIVGATVTWYYGGGTTATYMTDANGEVVIPEGQRTVGDHHIQIEQYGNTAVSDKYLPLVLRLPADTLVTVTAVSSSSSSSSSSSASSSSSSSSSESGSSGNPHMGDSSMALPVAGAILSLAVIAIFMRRKNIKSENKDSLN